MSVLTPEGRSFAMSHLYVLSIYKPLNLSRMMSLRALKATRNTWSNIGSVMELSFVEALSSSHLQIFANKRFSNTSRFPSLKVCSRRELWGWTSKASSCASVAPRFLLAAFRALKLKAASGTLGVTLAQFSMLGPSKEDYRTTVLLSSIPHNRSEYYWRIRAF